MQQRRTPGGARPVRRPTGRPGGARGVRAESRGRTSGAARGAEGVRSASRPAAARRAVPGGGVKRLSAPHPRRITGRATVLFAVLIALALAYTYPVRVYLDQKADIERMEAAQAAQRALIEQRSIEAAKWQDPAFIESEARRRFYMVYPGEVPVIVLNDPAGAARDAGAASRPAQPETPDPWYDTLWSSIRAADAGHPGR
ncbi:FtsB family cell division protein [Micromonospora fluostatini]|uniref:FtsB family cell division protein n=1 Tax=Micromonospora sp. JCM 30529 TaxID=3421643 RepID=UPI003D17C9CB